MRKSSFAAALSLGVLIAPTAVRSAEPPTYGTQPAPVIQTFVASGPSSEADLNRLRKALTGAVGVVSIDVRPTVGGAFVTVKGDALYTLLASHAKPVGFQLAQMTTRLFAGKGLVNTAEPAKLRAALAGVPGVDRVAYSPTSEGVALRVTGIAPYAQLLATGKENGFALRQVGGFVAAGATEPEQLQKLKAVLGKAKQVEQVELQPLTGGATLLVYGDVKNPELVVAAKSVGYQLSTLSNGFTKEAEFTVEGSLNTSDQEKLRSVVAALEETQRLELKGEGDALRLVVYGRRVRPDRIAASAAEAGFKLKVNDAVTLPTLTPLAGRTTPASYGDAVVEDPLEAGKPAPIFTLQSQDGVNQVSLGKSIGKKPLVLIFGSCTCPPFREKIGSVEKLYQTYKEQVDFLLVYVREAHPGSIVSVPDGKGGAQDQVLAQTSTVPERLQAVQRLMRIGNLTFPAVIDDLDNKTKDAYASWPIRFYVIGTDGNIALKGRPGPFGFQVPDLARWLRDYAK